MKSGSALFDFIMGVLAPRVDTYLSEPYSFKISLFVEGWLNAASTNDEDPIAAQFDTFDTYVASVFGSNEAAGWDDLVYARFIGADNQFAVFLVLFWDFAAKCGLDLTDLASPEQLDVGRELMTDYRALLGQSSKDNGESETPVSELRRKALDVRENAYVPYSQFKVGAALRTTSGAVFTGCNVENVAYPEGTCAEAGAIAAMAAHGEREIAEVYVVADAPQPVTPCGGCRQKIAEFAGPDARVTMATTDGEEITMTVAELLPGAFAQHHMDRT